MPGNAGIRTIVFGLLLGLVMPTLVAAAQGQPLPMETRAHELMRAEPPDWNGARQAFRSAAEDGSTRAMAYLGWMYEMGHGVEVDKKVAAQWYVKAANGGAHAYAIKLGWMYLGGDGLVANRSLAEKWFGQAIDAGHLPANIALASVLIADALGGEGRDRVVEARALLDDALAGGEVLASFFLARLYIEGIGGHPVDEDRAAHYTRIGAASGHAQMQGWLAVMYVRGAGVSADPVEAAFWAALAAAGGDPIGQQLHVALDSELSAEQKQTVMERTLRWADERGPQS